MNAADVAVVVLCLIGGYWLVAFLFDRSRTPPHIPAPEPAPVSEPAWADVLGVPADASLADIRRAYQLRIAEYHPDRVVNLGAELRELAERKSQAINAAYAAACRERGDPA